MSQVSELGGGMSSVCDYNNGQSYAVVGLAASTDATLTVSGVHNGTYCDAVTGRVVLDGPGKLGTDGLYLR